MLDQCESLSFPNGNSARCVVEGADDDAASLLERVGLAAGSGPVVVVCGGAGEVPANFVRKLGKVLGPALSHAAGACQASVVDGGTRFGVMCVTGNARRRDPIAMPVLVGVAPAAKVSRPSTPSAGDEGAPLEPHHSHFILAAGSDWGDETRVLFSVAAALAGDSPVVVVIAHGGKHTRREAEEAMERGWPILLVKRTRGVAARLSRIGRRPKWLRVLSGSELRRIAEYHSIATIPKRQDRIAGSIIWELSEQPILKHVWRTFAGYDTRATQLQRAFRGLQRLILVIGIAATALALLSQELTGETPNAVHWPATIAPAVIAMMIAWNGRRVFGKRWILLRAAAETVKSEAFRYRTKTDPYDARAGRDATLASRLEVISRELLDTEVNTGPVSLPVGPGLPRGVDPDSLTELDAPRYAERRTVDQLRYYRRRLRSKSIWRDVLQLVALAMGATGTILAASDVEPAIALTTAISAAAISYLTALQHEEDIVVYNRSAAALDSANLAWMTEDPTPAAFADLVERTEEILGDEVRGWTRRMARAMDEAAERQRQGGGSGA